MVRKKTKWPIALIYFILIICSKRHSKEGGSDRESLSKIYSLIKPKAGGEFYASSNFPKFCQNFPGVFIKNKLFWCFF